MRKNLGGLLCALMIVSIAMISWKPVARTKNDGDLKGGFSARELFEKYINNIYESSRLQSSGLDYDVFKKALIGFTNLKHNEKLPQSCAILTVVDFTKASSEKRMWIIDVVNNQLILNTLVAHGRGSGENMATRFSDRNDSHQSSLGFYVTDNTYFGDNGLSLKLDGMDMGFNGNARKRAIVVHGADYVNEGAIAQLGFLGRSYGCPAVPRELADFVINTIKDKTALFIYGNSSRYTSKYLDEDLAAEYISANPTPALMASL